MLLLILLLGVSSADACTVVRFDLDGRLVVARNHDWSFGEGLLIVNRRGLEKRALTPLKPVTWVSRFGSVSLTQFGREIPFAGMNEVGLTVDLLQLVEAEFPTTLDEEANSVNVVQWVQYQLDTAASVDDVIESLKRVVPMPMMASTERVHYFVTDAQGDCAVIEFLNGRAVVQHGTAATQCALANSTWADSQASLAQNRGRSSSEQRYATAVSRIGREEPEELEDQIDFALESLDQVKQTGLTQWQLVYLPQDRQVVLQTTRSPQRRWIDLDDLAFDSNNKTMVIDVDSKVTGDMSKHLVPFSSAENQRIVDNAFDKLLPAGFVRSSLKQLVLSYPETLRVVQQEAVAP